MLPTDLQNVKYLTNVLSVDTTVVAPKVGKIKTHGINHNYIDYLIKFKKISWSLTDGYSLQCNDTSCILVDICTFPT